jgi:predicted AAA+ superfamily ATPase
MRKHLREYIELGGFPEVLKNNNTSLLEQYFQDILYRDVIARYSIKHIREIKELCLYLASNPGALQSYQKLQRLTGLKSIGTVKNYLEALRQVFLFYPLDLFDFSVKRQIYNPSKVYGIDPALCSAISFQFSRNLGHLYEQTVFLELLRRKKEIYYWKSKKGLEVDFIVKEGLQPIEAIQVCLSLDADDTRKREIGALLSAKGELDVKAMTIVTDGEDSAIETDRGTVQVMSLWRWLLNETREKKLQ